MKFWFILLLVFLIGGCSSEPSESNATDEVDPKDTSMVSIRKQRLIDYDIKDILSDEKLTVLMENNTVSYFIYRGRNMGYEYEVLSQFAKYLGVHLDIVVVNDVNNIMDRLNNGDGEMLACHYTITEERKEVIDFTDEVIRTKQVLVQRLPEEYWKIKKADLDTIMVRKEEDFEGKGIHVFENSSFNKQLLELQKRFNNSFEIIHDTGYMDIEDLIKKVSEGEIDYTVSDANVAKINKKFYPNIDIELATTDETPIGFGIRKNSPGLKKAFNDWLKKVEGTTRFEYLKTKYFKMSKYVDKREGEYSNLGGGKISPYDEIIKREAAKGIIDWRLIASLMYQESKFNPNVRSWAGAFGLMQFMPATGKTYGVYPSSPPSVQIAGGVRKLNRNYIDWLKEVPDSTEALKFTLASYNAGKGHVDDARRLAYKNGLSDKHWENNVEYYMLLLRKRQFNREKDVKYGYVRGTEPVKYVRMIMSRYATYKKAFPEDK
jgi:membrane-bound lytic murein transglycosylase F